MEKNQFGYTQDDDEEQKTTTVKYRGGKRVRGEFEAESDEEEDYTSAAYAKPSRGGQQYRGGARGGKRSIMALNEDDFPTL